MVTYLNPLKNSLWLQATGLAAFCSVIAILVWHFTTSSLTGGLLPILITAGVILVTAILTGNIIANHALVATDFLARAILLVTREESNIEAPNPETLGASKEFLGELAKNIYSLASAGGVAIKGDSSKLTFFHTLINCLPLPVIALNKDRQISFANAAALKYIGVSASDINNKIVYDALNLSFTSDLTLEAWLDNSAKNAVTENEVWPRVRLSLPDDKQKQFDLAAHYSNNDSSGIETILVFFDRTDQYERDDRDLTFVALAVHELRTPLTIMRGYVEVFEDELGQKLDSEQTAFMHNMGASAQQLTSFVSNILNVSRVEQNALYLRIKEEAWPDVLQAACKDMELRASVHNKRLVYDIAKDMPTVAVDKVSIYEVISNLIDNAIKYTHTDEDILIRSYEKDGMIETTVTDKGVGISEPVMAHIFDKFYRAHQNKNAVIGSGLGLFLCRAIIIAHSGNIWVKSKEGKGATFGFTLPTFASVAAQIKNEDNKDIVRGAHGWIKNHSLYRD